MLSTVSGLESVSGIKGGAFTQYWYSAKILELFHQHGKITLHLYQLLMVLDVFNSTGTHIGIRNRPHGKDG